MTQTITIDPVTRLEGHGKITIQLNDARARSRTRTFHVTQVRGFERSPKAGPSTRCPA
jgi:NAD-reducing hydrogenase large subunit